MAIFSCQIEGLFSYNLLPLTQRHIVEVLVVKCVPQLLPWKKTHKLDFKQKYPSDTSFNP